MADALKDMFEELLVKAVKDYQPFITWEEDSDSQEVSQEERQ